MKELISTTCLGREIHLLWRPRRDEISGYISKGFVTVEMAEGQESFVDFRCLDHHNMYSHLPSACVTALKYYGTLESPFKLMVNHTDADCVLTGLTLMGLLPLNILEKLNIEAGILDTAPFSPNVPLIYEDRITLWKTSMGSDKQSAWSWLYGLLLFVDLFRNVGDYQEALARLSVLEQERKRLAIEDYEKARFSDSRKILLVAPSRTRGFDVQFSRQSQFPAESLQGWKHWCIIAYVEKSGIVTLSCPNRHIAEKVFGAGGLKNIYPKLPSLDGKSWGGREDVGGSPRGIPFPESLLNEVLKTLKDSLQKMEECPI